MALAGRPTLACGSGLGGQRVSPALASEPVDRVAALDSGCRAAPLATRDPVLVSFERRGIAEPFVNLPHQWALRTAHTEGDTAGFGARQRNMGGEMPDHGRNLVNVTANEMSAEMNVSHRPIFPHHMSQPWTTDIGRPNPCSAGLILSSCQPSADDRNVAVCRNE